MKNWEDCLVLKKIAIREALELLDRLATQILLVVDDQRHLLGTLTDGDTRRALLSGKSLTDSIEDIIYKSPLYVFEGFDSKDVLELMREKKIHQVPVLNTHGSVIGLKVIDDFLQKPERSENVFIMAGGLGSRLGELTKSTPKPMLHVGGKPILERILDNFSEQGFKKFYISINYYCINKATTIHSWEYKKDFIRRFRNYMITRNQSARCGENKSTPLRNTGTTLPYRECSEKCVILLVAGLCPEAVGGRA